MFFQIVQDSINCFQKQFIESHKKEKWIKQCRPQTFRQYSHYSLKLLRNTTSALKPGYSSTLWLRPPSCWIIWSWCWKSLTRRQSCETGVSVILRSEAKLLLSAGTCLWCPHIQPQSGWLRHTSETQISDEDKRARRHQWTSARFPLMAQKSPYYLTLLSAFIGN